jgi:hypothetical protein
MSESVLYLGSNFGIYIEPSSRLQFGNSPYPLLRSAPSQEPSSLELLFKLFRLQPSDERCCQQVQGGRQATDETYSAPGYCLCSLHHWNYISIMAQLFKLPM